MQVTRFGQSVPVRSAAPALASSTPAAIAPMPALANGDQVTFGSMEKLKAAANKENEYLTQKLRDELETEWTPNFPGAEPMTYMDVIRGIQDFIADPNNYSRHEQFGLGSFLSSVLNREETEFRKQLSGLIEKDLTELGVLEGNGNSHFSEFTFTRLGKEALKLEPSAEAGRKAAEGPQVL